MPKQNDTKRIEQLEQEIAIAFLKALTGIDDFSAKQTKRNRRGIEDNKQNIDEKIKKLYTAFSFFTKSTTELFSNNNDYIFKNPNRAALNDKDPHPIVKAVNINLDKQNIPLSDAHLNFFGKQAELEKKNKKHILGFGNAEQTAYEQAISKTFKAIAQTSPKNTNQQLNEDLGSIIHSTLGKIKSITVDQEELKKHQERIKKELSENYDEKGNAKSQKAIQEALAIQQKYANPNASPKRPLYINLASPSTPKSESIFSFDIESPVNEIKKRFSITSIESPVNEIKRSFSITSTDRLSFEYSPRPSINNLASAVELSRSSPRVFSLDNFEEHINNIADPSQVNENRIFWKSNFIIMNELIEAYEESKKNGPLDEASQKRLEEVMETRNVLFDFVKGESDVNDFKEGINLFILDNSVLENPNSFYDMFNHLPREKKIGLVQKHTQKISDYLDYNKINDGISKTIDLKVYRETYVSILEIGGIGNPEMDAVWNAITKSDFHYFYNNALGRLSINEQKAYIERNTNCIDWKNIQNIENIEADLLKNYFEATQIHKEPNFLTALASNQKLFEKIIKNLNHETIFHVLDYVPNLNKPQKTVIEKKFSELYPDFSIKIHQDPNNNYKFSVSEKGEEIKLTKEELKRKIEPSATPKSNPCSISRRKRAFGSGCFSISNTDTKIKNIEELGKMEKYLKTKLPKNPSLYSTFESLDVGGKFNRILIADQFAKAIFKGDIKTIAYMTALLGAGELNQIVYTKVLSLLNTVEEGPLRNLAMKTTNLVGGFVGRALGVGPSLVDDVQRWIHEIKLGHIEDPTLIGDTIFDAAILGSTFLPPVIGETAIVILIVSKSLYHEGVEINNIIQRANIKDFNEKLSVIVLTITNQELNDETQHKLFAVDFSEKRLDYLLEKIKQEYPKINISKFIVSNGGMKGEISKTIQEKYEMNKLSTEKKILSESNSVTYKPANGTRVEIPSFITRYDQDIQTLPKKSPKETSFYCSPEDTLNVKNQKPTNKNIIKTAEKLGLNYKRSEIYQQTEFVDYKLEGEIKPNHYCSHGMVLDVHGNADGAVVVFYENEGKNEYKINKNTNFDFQDHIVYLQNNGTNFIDLPQYASSDVKVKEGSFVLDAGKTQKDSIDLRYYFPKDKKGNPIKWYFDANTGELIGENGILLGKISGFEIIYIGNNQNFFLNNEKKTANPIKKIYAQSGGTIKIKGDSNEKQFIFVLPSEKNQNSQDTLVVNYNENAFIHLLKAQNDTQSTITLLGNLKNVILDEVAFDTVKMLPASFHKDAIAHHFTYAGQKVVCYNQADQFSLLSQQWEFNPVFNYQSLQPLQALLKVENHDENKTQAKFIQELIDLSKGSVYQNASLHVIGHDKKTIIHICKKDTHINDQENSIYNRVIVILNRGNHTISFSKNTDTEVHLNEYGENLSNTDQNVNTVFDLSHLEEDFELVPLIGNIISSQEGQIGDLIILIRDKENNKSLGSFIFPQQMQWKDNQMKNTKGFNIKIRTQPTGYLYSYDINASFNPQNQVPVIDLKKQDEPIPNILIVDTQNDVAASPITQLDQAPKEGKTGVWLRNMEELTGIFPYNQGFIVAGKDSKKKSIYHFIITSNKTNPLNLPFEIQIGLNNNQKPKWIINESNFNSYLHKDLKQGNAIFKENQEQKEKKIIDEINQRYDTFAVKKIINDNPDLSFFEIHSLASEKENIIDLREIPVDNVRLLENGAIEILSHKIDLKNPDRIIPKTIRVPLYKNQHLFFDDYPLDLEELLKPHLSFRTQKENLDRAIETYSIVNKGQKIFYPSPITPNFQINYTQPIIEINNKIKKDEILVIDLNLMDKILKSYPYFTGKIKLFFSNLSEKNIHFYPHGEDLVISFGEPLVLFKNARRYKDIFDIALNNPTPANAQNAIPMAWNREIITSTENTYTEWLRENSHHLFHQTGIINPLSATQKALKEQKLPVYKTSKNTYFVPYQFAPDQNEFVLDLDLLGENPITILLEDLNSKSIEVKKEGDNLVYNLLSNKRLIVKNLQKIGNGIKDLNLKSSGIELKFRDKKVALDHDLFTYFPEYQLKYPLAKLPVFSYKYLNIGDNILEPLLVAKIDEPSSEYTIDLLHLFYNQEKKIQNPTFKQLGLNFNSSFKYLLIYSDNEDAIFCYFNDKKSNFYFVRFKNYFDPLVQEAIKKEIIELRYFYENDPKYYISLRFKEGNKNGNYKDFLNFLPEDTKTQNGNYLTQQKKIDKIQQTQKELFDSQTSLLYTPTQFQNCYVPALRSSCRPLDQNMRKNKSNPPVSVIFMPPADKNKWDEEFNPSIDDPAYLRALRNNEDLYIFVYENAEDKKSYAESYVLVFINFPKQLNDLNKNHLFFKSRTSGGQNIKISRNDLFLDPRGAIEWNSPFNQLETLSNHNRQKQIYNRLQHQNVILQAIAKRTKRALSENNSDLNEKIVPTFSSAKIEMAFPIQSIAMEKNENEYPILWIKDQTGWINIPAYYFNAQFQNTDFYLNDDKKQISFPLPHWDSIPSTIEEANDFLKSFLDHLNTYKINSQTSSEIFNFSGNNYDLGELHPDHFILSINEKRENFALDPNEFPKPFYYKVQDEIQTIEVIPFTNTTNFKEEENFNVTEIEDKKNHSTTYAGSSYKWKWLLGGGIVGSSIFAVGAWTVANIPYFGFKKLPDQETTSSSTRLGIAAFTYWLWNKIPRANAENTPPIFKQIAQSINYEDIKNFSTTGQEKLNIFFKFLQKADFLPNGQGGSIFKLGENTIQRKIENHQVTYIFEQGIGEIKRGFAYTEALNNNTLHQSFQFSPPTAEEKKEYRKKILTAHPDKGKEDNPLFLKIIENFNLHKENLTKNTNINPIEIDRLPLLDYRKQLIIEGSFAGLIKEKIDPSINYEAIIQNTLLENAGILANSFVQTLPYAMVSSLNIKTPLLKEALFAGMKTAFGFLSGSLSFSNYLPEIKSSIFIGLEKAMWANLIAVYKLNTEDKNINDWIEKIKKNPTISLNQQDKYFSVLADFQKEAAAQLETLGKISHGLSLAIAYGANTIQMGGQIASGNFYTCLSSLLNLGSNVVGAKLAYSFFNGIKNELYQSLTYNRFDWTQKDDPNFNPEKKTAAQLLWDYWGSSCKKKATTPPTAPPANGTNLSHLKGNGSLLDLAQLSNPATQNQVTLKQ